MPTTSSRRAHRRPSLCALAMLAVGAGCLPEGPPGRGALVYGHDGLTRVFPAHGPEGAPDPAWLFGGRGSADDGAVDGGLYRLTPGGPATRLARTTLRVNAPWSNDGAFWFVELDESGAPPWSGQLRRVEPDGQVTSLGLPPQLAWDHDESRVTLAHLDGLTAASFDDGLFNRQLYEWHGTTPIAPVNDVYRVGDWYVGTVAHEDTGSHDLVRFRDDDLTPRLVLAGVTQWQLLPVVTHEAGWILAATDTEVWLVDPLTFRVSKAPLAVRPPVVVHPAGRLIAAFPFTTTTGTTATVVFIDPATWMTEMQVLNPTATVDSWNATWRPGHDELWASSSQTNALYAASPGAPVRAWEGRRFASGPHPAADLAEMNADRLSGLTFGNGSPFTSDGRELLTFGSDDFYDVRWLDLDVLTASTGTIVDESATRRVAAAGVRPRSLVVGAAPGDLWVVGDVLEERRLFFSARPPAAGAAPVLIEKGRGVARFFVSGDRALATLGSLGEPTRGDLVLLDAHGPDEWLGSQVIDFWPVASCPGCDRLGQGASLAYVVNALRPWERNGLWTCTLP